MEDWVYVNLTGDTHPMHMHLVTFQVVGRTPFDAEGVRGGLMAGPTAYPVGLTRAVRDRSDAAAGAGGARFQGHRQGQPRLLHHIRAKFELPSGVTAPQTYVYHCHIVEHEDNDMMRPFTVVP